MENKVLSSKFYVIRKSTQKAMLDCIKTNWFVFCLLAVAFIFYMVVIMPSGYYGCIEDRCGMHFWGAHEHDGIWHIALSRVSFNVYPFAFPTFSGQNLTGYNFLLDIVIWFISLFGFANLDLYFRIIPFVWFVTFSIILYKYSSLIRRNSAYLFFVYFFVFFSSSLGFVIQYARNNSISGSSGTPTMQGALSMTNPQFMWALLFLFLLHIVLHKRKNIVLIPTIVFVIAGLKIYGLLSSAILIAVYGIYNIYTKKYSYSLKLSALSIIAVILSYYIFYSGNKSGGIFIDFLAIPKQLIEDPNMWYRPDLVSKWYALKSAGLGPRYLMTSAEIILLFIIFNFGIRLLGFIIPFYYYFKKDGSRLRLTLIWLILTIANILMPIFFIQSGDWWNTIQFMYFGLVFGSLLIADTSYIVWTKNKYIGLVILICAIIIFLPAHFDLWQTFAVGKSSYIYRDEVDALSALAKMPDGIVMVQPFEKNGDDSLPSIYDTAYVSALSGKRTYFADKKQLELLDVDYMKRENELKKVSSCQDFSGISYVYLRKNTQTFGYYDKCVADTKAFDEILHNGLVKVWGRKL